MDEAQTDALAFHELFPKIHCTRFHSTNPIERLDREIGIAPMLPESFPPKTQSPSRRRYLAGAKWAQPADHMSLKTI
jgi:hypothetical protein